MPTLEERLHETVATFRGVNPGTGHRDVCRALEVVFSAYYRSDEAPDAEAAIRATVWAEDDAERTAYGFPVAPRRRAARGRSGGNGTVRPSR